MRAGLKSPPSLLSIIEKVLRQDVLDDFRQECIGTEHELQASLYSHLRRRLGEQTRILVEPRLNLGENSVIPDLCVLLGAHEILFIELKFQNAAGQGVVWEHDFEKFAKIESAARASSEIQFPGRGRVQPIPVPASRKYLFIAMADESCAAVHEPSVRNRVSKLQGFDGLDMPCFWAGGVTDKGTEHFIGPVQVFGSESATPSP